MIISFEAGCLGYVVWTPETLAVIIPASILSKHYFNRSKYYL